MFEKIGLINEDQKVSITNLAVYTFLFITAFKTLFSGADINIGSITWKIQALDMSETLPLLFSLLNYHGRRMTNNGEKVAVDEKQT